MSKWNLLMSLPVCTVHRVHGDAVIVVIFVCKAREKSTCVVHFCVFYEHEVHFDISSANESKEFRSIL